MIRVAHKKTGHVYEVLYDAIECTNGREDIPYTVYRRENDKSGKVFVRETKEFVHKFEYISHIEEETDDIQ